MYDLAYLQDLMHTNEHNFPSLCRRSSSCEAIPSGARSEHVISRLSPLPGQFLDVFLQNQSKIVVYPNSSIELNDQDRLCAAEMTFISAPSLTCIPSSFLKIVPLRITPPSIIPDILNPDSCRRTSRSTWN